MDIFQKIAVKRLDINVGIDPRDNKILRQTHVAAEGKTIHIVPGRYAVIEITQGTKKLVCEVPLGVYGWEYEPV